MKSKIRAQTYFTALLLSSGVSLAATQAYGLQPIFSSPKDYVLTVGPGQSYVSPSAAARAARPGDTIRIQPGTYDDCAVWQTRNITIEGIGGVTITGKTCGEKGLFVIDGDNVTVRNITFAGAKSRDHNGAGIRAEGANLTVEGGRFIDNEDGILSNASPYSTITIRDSYFRGNGNCIAACAHGIYIGHVATVRVEHSEFFEQHAGHHIKSRALRTELVDNRIHDGTRGDSSYLIDIPEGGTVLIRGNSLEKGPNSQNGSTAISIGAEISGAGNPSDGITIENNQFRNDIPAATAFVRNATDIPAWLQGNVLTGPVTPLEGPGHVNAGLPTP